MLFLVYAVAVSASVEALLPRLILSSRVTRGYAYEGRVTRMKNINALVDPLPDLHDAVPLAIKATLIGSHDLYTVMLKLHALFARLWAMQLKKLPVDQSLTKQVRNTAVSLPKEVSRIVDKIIAANRQLPNWNDGTETRVSAVVTDMKRSVQEMAMSIESLPKNLTEARVSHCGGVLRTFHFEAFFNLLNENVEAVITTAHRSPALSYLLSARSFAGLAICNSNGSLIRRLHKPIYYKSVVAITGAASKSLGELTRILVLERAAMVTGTFSQPNRFSFLAQTPGKHRYPGDADGLAIISRKNDEMQLLETLNEKVTSEVKVAGNAAMATGSSTALSRLEGITRRFVKISRERDTAFAELVGLRQEYLYKGYSYYEMLD